MNFENYQYEAHKTSRFFSEPNQRENMLMASLGLAGETGEIVDYIKKYVFHGHNIHVEKIKDELSDLLWYLAEMASCFNLDLEDIADHNIVKLQNRYGNLFTEEKSINRSLDRTEV